MNRNRTDNPYGPRTNSQNYYHYGMNNNVNNSRHIISELVSSYNDNIRHHNQIIEEYNHNIYTILNILQQDQNYNVNHTANHTANYTTPRTPPSRAPTSRRSQNHLDISSLFYLLNIPMHGNYDRNENRYIALTQEQIDISTVIVPYNREIHHEETCPISLDDFIVNEDICQIIGCGHYFKKNHIIRWFQNNHICPVCRFSVRNYQRPNIDSSNNNISSQTNNDNREHNIPRANTNNNEQASRYEEIVNNLLHISPEYNGTEYNEAEFINTPHTNETNINQFSRIITDIILEQIPNIDASNNLMYTLELPFSFSR